MKLLGITGGIGMGKSTSGAFLQQRGVAVADTDVIARELVEPGRPALLEIGAVFGRSILSPDGSLDRRELARRVFCDAAARTQLEAILHPKIRDIWKARAQTWRESGCNYGVVIIPLLFETKAESYFDAVVCVACSPATQWERLRKRGWDDLEIQQRLDAQLSVKQKIDSANFVIWTDTTLNAHAAQVATICQEE